MYETRVTEYTMDGDTEHVKPSKNCSSCKVNQNGYCALSQRPVEKKAGKPDWCKIKTVIGYLRHQNSQCLWCEYNKHKYGKKAPVECNECGWVAQRNIPYFVETPVYADNE